jgi:hypothetical protein
MSRDEASKAGEKRPGGPAATRATRRDTDVSADGVRRTVIDPMASWPELPAWPEGPRLFAEVETSSRRYVNLRPDDVGEMPRVRAGAEERIELRVNFPDGEPGEKIHVELPNGGSFADSDARGRVFILPENRTLSFPYITDDARGHCNVKLRHRGHNRSLPVWVGELPETAPTTPDHRPSTTMKAKTLFLFSFLALFPAGYAAAQASPPTYDPLDPDYPEGNKSCAIPNDPHPQLYH